MLGIQLRGQYFLLILVPSRSYLTISNQQHFPFDWGNLSWKCHRNASGLLSSVVEGNSVKCESPREKNMMTVQKTLACKCSHTLPNQEQKRQYNKCHAKRDKSHEFSPLFLCAVTLQSVKVASTIEAPISMTGSSWKIPVLRRQRIIRTLLSQRNMIR